MHEGDKDKHYTERQINNFYECNDAILDLSQVYEKI